MKENCTLSCIQINSQFSNRDFVWNTCFTLIKQVGSLIRSTCCSRSTWCLILCFVPTCCSRNGSRRCCVMSLGKPTRYRRLSFFVESGRCWAACWSCNYGFEELLSMVTSACDVKAVTSSTRWSRSSRASWRAIEEARRKRVIFKLVSSFKQPNISTPPAAKPIRWSLWGGASPRTFSVAMLTLSDI